ncbi:MULTISPECIES: C39 family peptidase [Paenibacillus]|uniref:C39 family peptidase n=1 Tax=Paenibacillus TaxID=44249 RepID=UPI0022B8D952|nr:C39 family peptidase [Paenibacillus caseinilyticus]MCZ8520256.1 C39 family peptidase [Paenibacillus caseinilyticus]
MKAAVIVWKGMQVTMGMFLIAGLLFASGVFSVLLYDKLTVQAEASVILPAAAVAEMTLASQPLPADGPGAEAAPAPVQAPSRAMLDAPLVLQKPELPSGCELTSLTMLLQYYGVKKTKMELLPEMKRDTTPITYGANGAVSYWGNPNTGFVGEITGAGKGFGIYHTALFELAHNYIPTAVDLTREPFSAVEQQLLSGVPVVVWTTIDFKVPQKWSVWDTPIGPIKTTFMEHAVLMVGFDENNVYVNDPLSGLSKKAIDKKQFLATWEAMGRQAISYTKP